MPDDYYLKDTQGRKIEVWPGSYRLNLTKPKVAEHQARFAYEQVLASGLLIDGCFFDNVFLTQSWQTTDIYGNSRPIDADEDGKPDDPARFDAAWRAGVISEIRQWRKLMPWAYASGHHFRPPDPEILELFNGDSIGFMTANVIENRHSFSLLWTTLSDWFERGRRPVIMMTESSPPHQIAYGYDYNPLEKIPPSTLAFAKTYHPYMRFGLGLTLMTDGYFAHEYGDTWHGNDWWYDELDFDLGYPLGPPARIPFGDADRRNRVTNGDFEQPLEGTWELWVNTEAGASATAWRDTTAAASGAASAKIEIASAGQRQNWHIDFQQRNRSLTGGASYELTFRAKADRERPLTVAAQKGSPDWRSYGLYQTVALGKEWQKYSVIFEATETVSDSRLQFLVGDSPGKVWLDTVELRERPREVFRRDFTNGTVLLNPSRTPASVRLGPGYRRLNGTQAPRYEYILDDSGPEFRAGSGWQNVEYDSGEWKAEGPFYHDWGPGCRRCTGECGPSEWGLALRGDGNYTIAAWWPAAPGSSSWSRQVVYELVAGGRVIASAAVDQTRGGDRWNVLFMRALRTSDNPLVRVRNLSAGEAVADALYLTSEARYNDGSPALTVDLEPMDAIVLERDAGQPYVNTGNAVVDAASFLTPVSRGSWATLFGTNLAPSARTWTAADFSGARMPLSLDGVRVKVNGVAAPVYYVSPLQINFQVPTDVEVGNGTVQVITPSGESNLAPVEVTEMWPALFLFAPDGRRYAAALHADGTVAARAGLLGEGVRSFPARPGETVVLWGSGFGPTTPPMASGVVLSAPLPLENGSGLAVTIGGRPAQVEYVGMTVAGVYQINVRVPEDLADGDHEVAAALGGLQTQSGAYLMVGR